MQSTIKSQKETQDNYNPYIEENQQKYLKVIPLLNWIEQDYISKIRFSPSFLKKTFSKALSNHLKFLEKITGKRFYVESKDSFSPKISQRVKELLSYLFEKKIVARLYRAKNLPDEPKTVSYYFQLNPIKVYPNKEYALHGSCGGCAPDSDTALMRACAEAFERHSVATCRKEKFIKESYLRLREKGAVDPLRFVPFSKNQLQKKTNYYKLILNLRKTEINWIEAKNLFDNKRYFVPAQLSCIFYESLKDEPRLRQVSTNGAAAGSSWEHATYAALSEAIERDALLIHYLNKISPPQISPESIKDPKINKLLETYKRYNLKVYILDITTDIKIPTLMVLAFDRTKKGPAVSIANKADFNPEETIFDILYDLLRVRPAMRLRLNKENFAKINKIYPDIRTIPERLLLWSQPKMVKNIEFLTRGKKKPVSEIGFSSEETDFGKKLEILKGALKSAGINEAYIIDITSQEARENKIWVAMSLVPALYPLYLNEGFKYLGVERLYQVPVKLGYFKKPKSEEEINKVPHPMA